MAGCQIPALADLRCPMLLSWVQRSIKLKVNWLFFIFENEVNWLLLLEKKSFRGPWHFVMLITFTRSIKSSMSPLWMGYSSEVMLIGLPESSGWGFLTPNVKPFIYLFCFIFIHWSTMTGSFVSFSWCYFKQDLVQLSVILDWGQ